MARLTRELTIDRPAEEVFDAIADFSTAQDWDPGVARSTATSRPPIGAGARFDLVLRMGPLTPTFTYETDHYERPRRVRHRTAHPLAVGVDDITVTATSETTCLVIWSATFDLRGPLGLFDRGLQVGFERVADAAVDGLAAWLRAGGHARHQPVSRQ